MTTTYLSPDELRELTGCAHRARQQKWLDCNRWPYAIAETGHIRVLLAQLACDRFEVARVERHRHRPASHLMNRGGGSVAFSDAQRRIVTNLAQQVKAARLTPMWQEVLVAALDPLREDRLQAVQSAGRAAYRHKQHPRHTLFLPAPGAVLSPARPGADL